jgi:two-component system OmpR family response regulator
MSAKRWEGPPKNSAASQQNGTNPTQATVLVVDDDKAVRNLLCETLNLHGYKVIATATAQEADTALQRLGTAVIGLVIADIQLTAAPQAREGYELYERWTTAYPTLPFLLISGDPTSQTLPAIRTDAACFLAKPFAISGLLATVQTLLGG